ncbi:WD repeat-containing protein [Schistosoma japonicum]|uniref:WD repeat-containing protein 44 n=1 Tax=Schistosoma japonicum TaxID=6182 RepID=A0A4Z2CS02_SCHJA|nr:WD repeat-containing protein [Schistosoma japonicum]
MSSEEDEFFDAPEAFGRESNVQNWSDNEDELIRTCFDFDGQNARRRSRLESLKKNLLEKSYSVGHASGTTSLDTMNELNALLPRNVSDHILPRIKTYQSEAGVVNIPSGDQELLHTINFHHASELGYFNPQQKNPSVSTYINVQDPSNSNNLSLLATTINQKQLIKTQFAQTQTVFRDNGSGRYHNECTLRPPMDVNICVCSNAAPATTPTAYGFVHPFLNDELVSHLPEVTSCGFIERVNFPVIQLLRSQVVSSAPEVSNRGTDAKHLLDCVKSWSLDTARQQNSGLFPSVNGTVTLDRVTNNNLPQRHTNHLGSNRIESLYTAALNRSQLECLFPQSATTTTTAATNTATVTSTMSTSIIPCNRSFEAHEPCLRHHSCRLVSTMVQTELKSNEKHNDVSEQTINSLHRDTLMNKFTTDYDRSASDVGCDKIVKSASATLNNEQSIVNPIEIQFRDRTRSNSSLPLASSSERQSNDFSTPSQENSIGVMRKMTKIHKYFRGAMNAMRSATKSKIFNPDEESSDEDEEVIGNQGIRLRSSRQARGRREFLQIKLVQEMKNEHTGAVWAMRFSPCGRLLATAGYDRNIRIWVLRQCYRYFKEMQRSSTPPPSSTKYGSVGAFIPNDFNTANDAASTIILDEDNRFDSLSLASTSMSTSGRTDISEADGASSSSSAPCYSTVHGITDDIPSPSSSRDSTKNSKTKSPKTTATVSRSLLQQALQPTTTSLPMVPGLHHERRTVFRSKPLLVLRGHEGVVTELAWSKNLFLLATSMDHQVRLWHISRRECLCVFSHNDTVPTIVFHPKDDRYFLSGSLDGKLRLWNIPDKKVRFWVEVPVPSALPVSTNSLSSSANTVANLFTNSNPYTGGSSHYSSILGLSSKGSVSGVGPKTVITCASFACEGTKVVVGTYDGRVLFFNSELSYITFITIKSGTTRGRHCRVTAIECDPSDSNKILVASNDSRLRLVDARDYHTLCKYRGFVNETSQIRGSFSPTGRYLISGSENAFFYIWQKSLDVDKISRFSRVRKDRNNCWEAIKAHDTMVTVAIFSPNPNLVLDKHSKHKPLYSSALSNYSELSNKSSNQLLTAIDLDKKTLYLGELVVSADCNGCIRVFKKYSTETAQSTCS